MEPEKRKRKGDGESNGGRGKAREEDDRVSESAKTESAVPPDEEVDEFFAILKRVRLAVDYFRQRNAVGGCPRTKIRSPAAPWSPAFEHEDFDGSKKGVKRSPEKHNWGLDLNSHPNPDDDSDNKSDQN